MHIPDNQQQQINLRKESTIATANKSKLTHVNKTSNKIQKKNQNIKELYLMTETILVYKIRYPVKKKKVISQKQKDSKKIYHGILADITLELSNSKRFSRAKYDERLAVEFNDPKVTPKSTNQF